MGWQPSCILLCRTVRCMKMPSVARRTSQVLHLRFEHLRCGVCDGIFGAIIFGNMLLKRMDEIAFLGFNAWDFCVRSLIQPYGRFFLRSVILRHPLQAISGVLRYRKRLRSLQQTDIVPIGIESEARFHEALFDCNLLVGIGFCQKPVNPPCPAGRFNHQCLFLEHAGIQAMPAACNACPIREIATRAIPAGASIYIMTSAISIAQDVLLPNFRSPYSRFLFAVCPYSIPPLTLAMSICGLQGLVFAFSRGDCLDYTAWLNADKGTKSEQTFLSSSTQEKLIELLDAGAPGDLSRYHIEQRGNLYIPSVQKPGYRLINNACSCF